MSEENKRAEFKDRLQEALTLRGLRPADLSKKTDIPKSMVSYYLSGKTTPKTDRLYLIAQELNVNATWLLGFDAPVERPKDQKNNDALIDVVKKLRNDPEFFDVVQSLARLPQEEYASIKRIISALGDK